MVGALTPFAIVLGGTMAVGLLFFSFWRTIAKRVSDFGNAFRRELDIADMRVKAQDIGFIVIAFSAIAWTSLVVFLQPDLLVGALLLPVVFGFAGYAAQGYIRLRVQRRIKQFQSQLELMLRSLASGVRVGLGLRQALIQVSEQAGDPVRKELTRVVGATNLGVSILDALDDMAARFPTPENQILVRVIRVNAQSGGDLGSVLDDLADTIRDRRRFDRRVSALTAQGRASAFVLAALPPGVAAIICFLQPQMREALLHTTFGQLVLLVGSALDFFAVLALFRITKIDV